MRATRSFEARVVEDRQVASWLDAVRWCGSSKNSQPWRFIVVRTQSTLSEMATFGDYATHLALCNVAIAIAMEDTAYDFSRVFDLGRVAQSLMLVAHDDGVGSCVAVFEPHANVARANELLGVPERFSIDVAIGFGYRSSRQPERLGQVPVGRHPLSRIYFEEVFGRSPGRG